MDSSDEVLQSLAAEAEKLDRKKRRRNILLPLIVGLLVVISLTPLIIQWIEAKRIGVSVWDLKQAREQNRLWHANFECARLEKPSSRIDRDGVLVEVRVCTSGDVLVSIKKPGHERFQWIKAPGGDAPK